MSNPVPDIMLRRRLSADKSPELNRLFVVVRSFSGKCRSWGKAGRRPSSGSAITAYASGFLRPLEAKNVREIVEVWSRNHDTSEGFTGLPTR